MNVLFFLKPKGELAYLYEDHTLRQGIEKLERSGFTAIPVISRSGEYIGTITEGDFLWTLKNKFSLDLKMAEDVPIQTVKRRMRFDPISIDSNMEDLVSKARNQNFVPVIDDKKIFIGIVTRKDIIDFCYQEYIEKEGKSSGFRENGRELLRGKSCGGSLFRRRVSNTWIVSPGN